jgi:hypothetical protein
MVTRVYVTSSGSREGALTCIAFKAYTPSRLPLEVTRSRASSLFYPQVPNNLIVA